MKLRILYHGNCFDGVSSAAIFTKFYRAKIHADAAIGYTPVMHKAGNAFDTDQFDGDENVIVAAGSEVGDSRARIEIDNVIEIPGDIDVSDGISREAVTHVCLSAAELPSPAEFLCITRDRLQQ